MRPGEHPLRVAPKPQYKYYNHTIHQVSEEIISQRIALKPRLYIHLFVRANAVNVSFNDLNDNDKFVYLLNDCNIVNFSASILHRMLIRRRILFQ